MKKFLGLLLNGSNNGGTPSLMSIARQKSQQEKNKRSSSRAKNGEKDVGVYPTYSNHFQRSIITCAVILEQTLQFIHFEKKFSRSFSYSTHKKFRNRDDNRN